MQKEYISKVAILEMDSESQAVRCRCNRKGEEQAYAVSVVIQS